MKNSRAILRLLLISVFCLGIASCGGGNSIPPQTPQGNPNLPQAPQTGIKTGCAILDEPACNASADCFSDTTLTPPICSPRKALCSDLALDQARCVLPNAIVANGAPYGCILNGQDCEEVFKDCNAIKAPSPTRCSIDRITRSGKTCEFDPGLGICRDATAAPLTGWELYQALKPGSNEAVLIQRAASYITDGLKQDGFSKASDAQKNASVKKVIESKNFPSIVDMLNKMSPVHRCKYGVLASIDKLGFALSTEILKSSSPRNPDFGHIEFTEGPIAILAQTFQKKWQIPKIENVIKLAIVEHYIEIVKDPSVGRPAEIKINECNTESQADFPGALKNCRDKIKPLLVGDQKIIKEFLEYLTIFLNIGYSGIGYHVDVILGTDKFVFSILGIHRNLGYGNIALQINKDLLSDSNTFTTPVAATYIYGGVNSGDLAGRPWITPKANDLKHYEENKIKESLPGVVGFVFAFEFMARLKAYHAREFKGPLALLPAALLGPPDPSKDILALSPDDVRHYMESLSQSNEGNHTLPEIHLPVFLAGMIEKIFLIKSLDDYAKKNLVNEELKKKLIVINADNDFKAIEASTAP